MCAFKMMGCWISFGQVSNSEKMNVSARYYTKCKQIHPFCVISVKKDSWFQNILDAVVIQIFKGNAHNMKQIADSHHHRRHPNGKHYTKYHCQSSPYETEMLDLNTNVCFYCSQSHFCRHCLKYKKVPYVLHKGHMYVINYVHTIICSKYSVNRVLPYQSKGWTI